MVNLSGTGMPSSIASIVSTPHSILRPQSLSSTTLSSVRTGAERVPITTIGHTGRQASGVGEAAAHKESMNCKSCRKKKIKCNRMRPSCGACLAFQCACIYDAIPKKRGPKTEVLEELLKRVSGLEKRLAEEKEANIAKKMGEIKTSTSNGGLPVTELIAGQDWKQQSLESAESRKAAKSDEVSETGLTADHERSDGHGATSVNLPTTGTRDSDPISEPPPYASLSPDLEAPVTDFGNSWTLPIKILDTPPSVMKRRRTSDAETQSKEATEVPVLKRTRSIISHMHLQSTSDKLHHHAQVPDSYIDAFFREFHGKPHEILHEETFRATLAQGAIHHSQLDIVCAIGAKYVHSGPHGHSLCAQFTETARAAVDMEFPSFESFQTLLLISISYFYLGKGYKTFMLLGTTVRMAYGLDLNRELPPNELVTPVEREVRRRAFWACYLLDRFVVCGSRRPPILLEESIQLQLPSSMPLAQMRGLDEQFISSHMGLAGPGAGQSLVGGLLAPRRQAENASALCIGITKLLGTAMRYIEQGGVKGDIHFPWHAQSNLTKIRCELDHWAARTLTWELYSQTPGAAQGHGLYLRHPDVTLLVMAKAIFHLVSCLIYRPFLAVEFGGNPRRAHQVAEGVTAHAHGPEVGHGGQQQIWQAEATKMCFVHANAIGDLVEVLKSTKPEGFQWPAILGYCIVTAATIHLHGAYYQNTEHDPVLQASKGYFDREMQYIHDFRNKWPAARVQYVVLKRLKKTHEELVQQLTGTSSLHNSYCGVTLGLGYPSGASYWPGKQNVSQLDDFFQRYPIANREKYFDGAQCPFVEDMIETAAELSLNDELVYCGPSRMRLQNKTGKISEGFAGATAPHVFPSRSGDSYSISHDILYQKQYPYAQESPTSNPQLKKMVLDSDQQKGQGNVPSISTGTSASTFDYLRKVEIQSPSSPASSTSTCTRPPAGQPGVNTPRSTLVAGNFDTNVKVSFPERYAIFSAHTSPDLIRGYPVDINPTQRDPLLTSKRSTSSNTLDSQEMFNSVELNPSNWLTRENSALFDNSQDVNTRIQGLEHPQSVSVRSGNPNQDYSLQGEVYLDHSDLSPMETEDLSDGGHIRSDDFGGSGAQLHTEYFEQPDPFLLTLAQIVEERNSGYGYLSRDMVMHSGTKEAPTHMKTASGSRMSSTEAGILYTSSHVQPIGTGLHFGSDVQIDPTRPTVVNMGMGTVTKGYSDSWMPF